MRFKDLQNTLKKYNLPVKINIDTKNGIISKYLNKANTNKYNNLIVISSYVIPTHKYIVVDLLGD